MATSGNANGVLPMTRGLVGGRSAFNSDGSTWTNVLENTSEPGSFRSSPDGGTADAPAPDESLRSTRSLLSRGLSEERAGQGGAEELTRPTSTQNAQDERVHKQRLSTLSRFFLVLAVFQALAVISFQASILAVGNFSPIADGGLGKDRKFYAILFMSAMGYMIGLGWWSLHSENIVEVYAFVFLQLLSTMYGCAQVYQFVSAQRDWDDVNATNKSSQDYDLPIKLSSVNVGVNILSLLLFFFLTINLYMEFGWKIYRQVMKFDIKLRSAYRLYQVFTCFLKIELFFTEMFFLFHVTLLLQDNHSDPEFGGSIFGLILAFMVVPLMFLAARREIVRLFYLFIVALLCLLGYYSFKAYRFISKTCPLCEKQDKLSKANGDSSLSFEQLTMSAFLAIISTVLLLAITVRYLRSIPTGLKEHFAAPAHETRLERFLETIIQAPRRGSMKSHSMSRVPSKRLKEEADQVDRRT